MKTKLSVNQEFKDFLPKLSKEEFEKLEGLLLKEGIRDPLVTWKGVIIDGHNRYAIAEKHDLDFQTFSMDFENEDDVKLWMIENQLGKRNLSDAQRIEFVSMSKDLLVKKGKEKQKVFYGNQHTGGLLTKSSKVHESDTVNVRKEIATKAGVSEDTVRKYNKLKEEASPELLEQVMTGEKKINTAFREIQTGTRICTICKEEKPASEFPANGSKFCRKCQDAKRKKPKQEIQYDEDGCPILDPNTPVTKEEVAAFEKWLHRPTPKTNAYKAMEVVDGFGWQIRHYYDELTKALEKVSKQEEREEIINAYAAQIETAKNYLKELVK